jgi:hypothetical protein
MFKTNTFLMATAIASLIALPVLAFEMPADIMLGATPEDTTTLLMIEDSAFIGNEVRTSDQKVIGLVDAVYNDAAGTPVAMITLNSDIGAASSVKSFTVPLGADMVADGSLTLGWTEQDLFKELSANLPVSDN